MSLFTPGVVSNVWAALLPETSLAALCREAVSRGYGYVELRQRALGECEAAGPEGSAPRPLADRLAQLARGAPELGFNLAVEVPFLTEAEPVDREGFAAAVEAARALGGEPPLLRLVDVTPTQQRVEPAGFVACVRRTKELALQARADGVRLSLENSRQPVSTLMELIEITGRELADPDWAPLLCWDAANQLNALVSEDPHSFATSLSADRLGIFHFKQLREGGLQPDVGEGRIDWRLILTRLRAKNFSGPALFEIPPAPDIWDRLERSRAYVEEAMGTRVD